MTNEPGKADHGAAPSSVERLVAFLGYARKALVAFLVGGGGTALAEGIRTMDFENLSWGNLWTGIGVGLVSAFVVYWTSNAGKPASLANAG